MEKASLGPSKAWLVRHPIDGGPLVNAAGEPGESISLVYALTCQDLQLSDLVIQKQFIDVLEPLADFSSVNSSSCFSKPSKDLQLQHIAAKSCPAELCRVAPLALFLNLPHVILVDGSQFLYLE